MYHVFQIFLQNMNLDTRLRLHYKPIYVEDKPSESEFQVSNTASHKLF